MKKPLEIAADITIAAIQSGKLLLSPESVAAFFDAICEAAERHAPEESHATLTPKPYQTK